MFAAHRARRTVFFTTHPVVARRTGLWERVFNDGFATSTSLCCLRSATFGHPYHTLAASSLLGIALRRLFDDLKMMTPLSQNFLFWFLWVDIFLFLVLCFLKMSQLIRSFLIGRLRFGSIFGWLLRGCFFRPLSVKIIVFDIWIIFVLFLKTLNRRPLSHFRCFLVLYETLRNRVSLARRSICGVFFFSLFCAPI